ncbi:hypothetical protein HDV04_002792 [Boothiomyces sp. JEL0838]|nr:hypothetical protein HDV04_002792 [Boothiomyces sp. JEL0838]
MKPQVVDFSDSNIANLGTELEKKVKLSAAQTEEAWKDVGKQEGLWVWRIENFKVIPVPKESYGSFYGGDSYIVLHTYKLPDGPKLYHDVHFWLGQETTQDEAGTAAYKTVELDDFLLGIPVQHREVQGYESPLFVSYFKQLRVLKGGVASGFKHVEEKEYKTRLLRINVEHKTTTIREVPLGLNSLNRGDVFVVDAGLTIIQWNGSKSNGLEKNKAMEFTRALVGERPKAKITVYDEGDTDAGPFWAFIGERGTVPEENKVEEKPFKKLLLCVSDSTGPLKTTVVATDKFKRDQLKTEDVFILDVENQVYVWIGKGATKQEKNEGFNIAIKYLNEQGRNKIPISRILEGGENQVFEAYFDK